MKKLFVIPLFFLLFLNTSCLILSELLSYESYAETSQRQPAKSAASSTNKNSTGTKYEYENKEIHVIADKDPKPFEITLQQSIDNVYEAASRYYRYKGSITRLSSKQLSCINTALQELRCQDKDRIFFTIIEGEYNARMADYYNNMPEDRIIGTYNSNGSGVQSVDIGYTRQKITVPPPQTFYIYVEIEGDSWVWYDCGCWE